MRILSRLDDMVQFSLDLFAASAELGDDGIDTILVDGTQCMIGHFQFDPTVFTGNPETAFVNVRQKSAAGGVIRMGDVVTRHHALAGYLANSTHGVPREKWIIHSPDKIGPVSKLTRIGKGNRGLERLLRSAATRKGGPASRQLCPYQGSQASKTGLSGPNST